MSGSWTASLEGCEFFVEVIEGGFHFVFAEQPEFVVGTEIGVALHRLNQGDNLRPALVPKFVTGFVPVRIDMITWRVLPAGNRW